MILTEFAESLGLKAITPPPEDIKITGCYVGDLLSRVMSHAQSGNAWVTIMSNVNVAAVAVLTDVACVILAENTAPDENLVQKCTEQGVTLYTSGLDAYTLAYKIHMLLEK